MEAKAPKSLKLKKRLDEALYEEMLNNFLQGRYVEYTEFNPATIAEEYGISVTPVTLTLKRLFYEGLIDRTKGGKYLVPACSAVEVAHLCEVRFIFEQMSAFRIIDTNNTVAIQRLAGIAENCERLNKLGDVIGSIRSDLDLHKALVESYGNTYLSSLYMQIRNKLISLHYAHGFHTSMQCAASEEHKGIIRAMSVGDKKLASDLLQKHVNDSRDRIVEYISNG